MNLIDRISSPRAAVAGAVLAAFAFAIGSMITVLEADTVQQDTIKGIAHVAAAALSLALAGLVPVTLRLGGLGDSRRAAAVGATGLLGLAVLATTSNINGSDLGIFPPVAIAANLMIVGGFIAVAIGLAKRSVVSGWVAATIPLSFLVALGGSVIGLGVLVGAYWLAVAAALHRENRSNVHPEAVPAPA